MMPTHLTFIDIETTALAGPDAGTDAIIEIAAARVDLATRTIVEEWSALILPPADRPSLVDADGNWRLGDFHAGRFDDVDWSDGITLQSALLTLATGYEVRSGRKIGEGFLRDGATIAGQKPSFDLEYIRRDWTMLGNAGRYDRRFDAWPKLDYHVVDLCSPAFLLAMMGAIPGCSLRHTLPLARPGATQTHRAIDDVRAEIEVFWLLADLIGVGWRAFNALRRAEGGAS